MMSHAMKIWERIIEARLRDRVGISKQQYGFMPGNGTTDAKFAARMLSSSSSLLFEGYPLQARHKQDQGQGFILLLFQTAALPGSDAGSDVIKPASSFVIQNHQTSCSMWCPMYRARC